MYVKKLFTAILIISVIIMTFNSKISIQTIPEEDIEEQLEEMQIFDKTLSCMAEISRFGKTMQMESNYKYFTETQNKLTHTFNKFINFVMFPVNLGFNLINTGFNCIAILADWDYRSEILINYNWVDNDFSSGTSYGGGGGGFKGGR